MQEHINNATMQAFNHWMEWNMHNNGTRNKRQSCTKDHHQHQHLLLANMSIRKEILASRT